MNSNFPRGRIELTNPANLLKSQWPNKLYVVNYRTRSPSLTEDNCLVLWVRGNKRVLYRNFSTSNSFWVQYPFLLRIFSGSCALFIFDKQVLRLGQGLWTLILCSVKHFPIRILLATKFMRKLTFFDARNFPRIFSVVLVSVPFGRQN